VIEGREEKEEERKRDRAMVSRGGRERESRTY
jgi:hypothetical protein